MSKVEKREDVIIYGLKDPVTRRIEYIGKTGAHRYSERIKEHQGNRASKKIKEWIDHLRINDIEPEMVIVEQLNNVTQREWAPVERFWIETLQIMGEATLNVAVGGGDPPPGTTESGKKASATRKANGYTDSPETLENKKRAQRERVARYGMHPNLFTPETNHRRSLRIKHLYETGQKTPVKLTPEAQAIADRKKSESLKGRQMATEEEYKQRGEVTRPIIKQQWEEGHYDNRAKTGPEAKTKGRIYPEDHQDIVDMYLADYTQGEIATYYDVDRSNVGKLLDKLGVYKEKVDHAPEMIRLYTEENRTVSQIADHFGMSSDNIRKKLKENGVEIRKTSLTAEKVAEAHRREQEGEKRKDIAAEYNVTSHALGERVRKYRQSLEG